MGCFQSSLVLEGVEINLDVAPTDDDRALYDSNAAVLKECDGVLERMRNYVSCAEECRMALSDATAQNRLTALEAVTRTAMDVHDHYRFGHKVSDALVAVVDRLVSSIPAGRSYVDPQTIKFKQHSSLVMQLAELLSFIIQFDNVKVLTGTIQNDLSMYRRMCQISKKTQDEGADQKDAAKKLSEWQRPEELDPDTVSAMSFFIASSIPIMTQCVTKLLELASKDNRVDAVFPHVANLFLVLVSEKRFGETSDKYQTCLEAMTCSMIVCDRVEPEGVFHSKSMVQVGDGITLLKRYHQMFPDAPENHADNLLNNLRYYTVHLKDATTPLSITKKLDTQ